jgi:hypothetical protein
MTHAPMHLAAMPMPTVWEWEEMTTNAYAMKVSKALALHARRSLHARWIATRTHFAEKLWTASNAFAKMDLQAMAHPVKK